MERQVEAWPCSVSVTPILFDFQPLALARVGELGSRAGRRGDGRVPRGGGQGTRRARRREEFAGEGRHGWTGPSAFQLAATA